MEVVDEHVVVVVVEPVLSPLYVDDDAAAALLLTHDNMDHDAMNGHAIVDHTVDQCVDQCEHPNDGKGIMMMISNHVTTCSIVIWGTPRFDGHGCLAAGAFTIACRNDHI